MHKVDLWRWSLDEASERFDTDVLNVEERERALRLRDDQERHRFTQARAGLRCLMGTYLDQMPGSLILESEESGKPRLSGPDSPFFNLSHSGGAAALAICRTVPVGLDIEEALSSDKGASRLFSAAEREMLASARPGVRHRVFLEIWTRKEALLKGVGNEIATALDSFTVCAGPVARILAYAPDPAMRGIWSIMDLPSRLIGEGLVGALAIRNQGEAVEIVPHLA